MRKGKNIHKRKDGRWEARAVIGRDDEGKLLYKFLYGHSYREAAEKKAAFERSHVPAASPSEPCKRYRFRDVAILWMASMEGKWKRSTRSRYQDCLQNHIIPRWGEKELSELGQTEYDTLIAACSGQLTANSMQTVNTVINGIIRFSLKEGYLTERPFTTEQQPGRGEGAMEILNEGEIRKITEYCRFHPNPQKLGILIALYEGIRIGELCALRWRDVDTDARVIHIRGTLGRVRNLSRADGEPKTVLHMDLPKNGRERIIPIHPELLDVLEEQGRGACGNHFVIRDGRPYEPRSFSKYFKDMLALLDIRDIHFHALRHTFASRCVEQGVDIKALSEIMGHSSVRITMDRYVHLTMQFKREQLGNLRISDVSLKESKK